MPALDFPDSPNPGDIFLNWEWDGAKWTALAHHWSPPEAPLDHKTYGRRDGEWEQVLPIEGGTITGDLIVAGHTELGTMLPADTVAVQIARNLEVFGRTLVQTPVLNNEAATKLYVDNEFLKRRHIETITGDGTQKVWGIPHDFGSMDVVVQVYDEANWDLVITDVKSLDADTVEISFELPPDAGHAYRVVVMS